MVSTCDQIVEKLGLDWDRKIYFFNSRKGDITHSSTMVYPKPMSEVVIADSNTSKPNENELSPLRWYYPETVIEYEIPKDTIAIKNIHYKFKHTGAGSACIIIWETTTNKWMSTIHKHHDENSKSLDHTLNSVSSDKNDYQSEFLNTLKSGDRFIIQIASWDK